MFLKRQTYTLICAQRKPHVGGLGEEYCCIGLIKEDWLKMLSRRSKERNCWTRKTAKDITFSRTLRVFFSLPNWSCMDCSAMEIGISKC
jgi:hypothetical protein